MRKRAITLVAFLALVGASAADVLKVGVGPQDDFDEIADAVEAAADGDTILVSPGFYARFAVENRELKIIGTGVGLKRVVGLVRIRNLERGRAVLMSGLLFDGQRDEGLLIYGNEGLVFLQDCVVRGGEGINILLGPHEDGYAAIAVENSTGVSITDCSLFGGPGAPVDDFPTQWGFPSRGGSALQVEDSAVTVSGCVLRGGRGGDDFEGPDGFAEAGGHGVEGLAGASIWLNGSVVEGGRGGDVEYAFYCGDAGGGGHGLYLSDIGGGAIVRQLDTTPLGGEGGTSCGGSYFDGVPGLDVLVRTGNTVVDLPGSAARLVADTVSDQNPVLVTVEGQPGAQVWVLSSRESAWRPRPRGVLLLGTLLLGHRAATGTIPASGSLTFPVAIPPGARAGSLHGVQALVVEPGARSLTGVHWHVRE